MLINYRSLFTSASILFTGNLQIFCLYIFQLGRKCANSQLSTYSLSNTNQTAITDNAEAKKVK